MADQEDEDLKLALSMSMQFSPPEPKRSKPGDAAAPSTPEDTRRTQRELMAAAAEKRMLALRGAPASASASASSPLAATSPTPPSLTPPKEETKAPTQKMLQVKSGGKSSVCKMEAEEKNKFGRELTIAEAHQLFSVVFGDDVSKGILAQWSNQGIRFSLDPETSMGLVQHEGGPCGVLAAVQAFVLKYLIFFLDEVNAPLPGMPGPSTPASRQIQGSDNFASLSEDVKLRALIKSMSEILFSCGNGKTAVITTLDVLADDSVKDEAIAKALEGICIESASDLQKFLRVETYSSEAAVLQRLQATLPFFQSRMGAMLFLISALLSRGLDAIQADRDDPTLPLVTAPFGHASQEIVNLLLCGEAVPNVFDGRMDLGGGMFLKGISTSGEVGFLTLLESLNFCKVGQHLKCPKWPIWVVGSESHYTVLFALDTNVQKENELEQRESLIRRKFDQKDESGGGGFISVEAFHEFLRESDLRLPPEKIDSLCSSGFIVWSELWQIVLDLDKNLGGLKDSLMGKKVFDLYHFNGIAKSDLNGSGRETSVQRPRLTKLRVSVPPRWTPEEFMADVGTSSSSSSDKAEPPQHAPLVDCIRTRWARAVCNWAGDPPSIV